MDDLHKMHAFINDFWQFVKANFTVSPEQDTGEYWAKMAETVSAICKKYDNHPAVMQTIFGYMDYLEHEGSGRERVKDV